MPNWKPTRIRSSKHFLNYKIEITKIRATIGPYSNACTRSSLHAGVRISRIKNLEDDIALSLAALGIRIIAPMPGKGTIGIEVPNKKETDRIPEGSPEVRQVQQC